MNPYREKVLSIMQELLSTVSPVQSVLDFGAGDGWFAQQLTQQETLPPITAIDVQERPQTHYPIAMYDGKRLPYDDQSFDLSYSVDVLHHCPEPTESLVELARTTKRFLLLKDHTYSSALGYWTLCLWDELGNRKYGIPSRYKYQRDWHWFTILESQGFRLRQRVHPAAVHHGWAGYLSNDLQFVALWERQESSGTGTAAKLPAASDRKAGSV